MEIQDLSGAQGMMPFQYQHICVFSNLKSPRNYFQRVSKQSATKRPAGPSGAPSQLAHTHHMLKEAKGKVLEKKLELKKAEARVKAAKEEVKWLEREKAEAKREAKEIKKDLKQAEKNMHS
jgi:hypothetical protein